MDAQNQSHVIETQLIGAILKDGKVFDKIADITKLDYFHSTICRDIFSAAQKVRAENMTVDVITVGDQLQRDGVLESIQHDVFSGRVALGKMREAGNPRNAESYAMNVQDYWGKRQVLEQASKIAHWAQNGRRAADILNDARNLFDEINAQVGTGNSRTVDAATAASRSYDETVLASQGKIRFQPTGLHGLDAWFRIRAGSLTIIAARPGQGKTALLITIALNNARIKKENGAEGRILFLSMEMTVEELTARFLSQISGVPATRILDGQMTESEWQRYLQAVEEFEKLPIVINDIPAMSVQTIRAEARRWLTCGDNDLLIVDYLQLATSGENKKMRYEEVGAVTRGLKIFAGESRTPVLCAAAMSRAVEQRASPRPILSDLRESGNIEADANNIIFIYQDESEAANVSLRNLIVAKQRNGATSADKGDVIVKWTAELTKFDNVELQAERFGN